MNTSAATMAKRGLRSVSVGVAVISFGVNLLLLASPLYMLQVFDRVLSGRSLETLIFLSIAVAIALLVMGALDACRIIILSRFGDWLEIRLNKPLLRASLSLSARPNGTMAEQPFSDLSSVRQFLGSAGPGAMFDAPLMPIFIAIIWLIDPTLGLVAIGSALLLATIAVASEVLTRKAVRAATVTSAEGQTLLVDTLANADVTQTMGLGAGLANRWSGMRNTASLELLKTSTLLGVLGTSSKAFRLAVQAAILGTGAYLVIERVITPGEMIACSIILARALSPIETAIGSWRQFVAARQAWRRIIGLLTFQADQSTGLALPTPKGALQFEKVMLSADNVAAPLLRGINFAIPAGAILGIMGPSGSGKSSVARLASRAWSPTTGTVRIDNADLTQWDADEIGQHVGYLPQNAQLFHGTVRDNISRFTDVHLDDVVAAATLAGAHEMILGLPAGYETLVGPRGGRLSGGQRQRIALSRAVFGDPKLLVFDEPDASLDHPGQQGLFQCINRLKAAGKTVVIVAHKRNVLSQCDWLMMIARGQVEAFGPAHEVAERMQLRSAEGVQLHAIPGNQGAST